MEARIGDLRLPVIQKGVQSFEAEVEEGSNTEYKLHLVNPSVERFRGLVTQLLWRCREGRGHAIYRIGVADAGQVVGLPVEQMEASLHTFREMCAASHTDIVSTHVFAPAGDERSRVAEIRVRRAETATAVRRLHEVRLAVLGGPASGKSTLVACLTTGCRDDGRGCARFRVFRHRHEVESGSTSSIGHHVLGFDAEGRVTNATGSDAAGGSPSILHLSPSADGLTRHLSPSDLVARSSNLLHLIDLAGDARFLKSTIAGLLGSQPDFAAVLVSLQPQDRMGTDERLPATRPRSHTGGAPMPDAVEMQQPAAKTLPCSPLAPAACALASPVVPPPSRSCSTLDSATRDHLALAISLKVPFFVILSKVDGVPPSRVQTALQDVSDNLPREYEGLLTLVQTTEEALSFATQLSAPLESPAKGSLYSSKIPAFAVSNVTGQGTGALLAFLAALLPRQSWCSVVGPVEFAIEDVLSVEGETIVSGLVRSGTLEAGPQLLALGPDLLGNFLGVRVRSIQSNRIPVASIPAGRMCTCLLVTDIGGPLPRATARRGQVLLYQGDCTAGGSPGTSAFRRQTSAPAPVSGRRLSGQQECSTRGSTEGIALGLPAFLAAAPPPTSAPLLQTRSESGAGRRREWPSRHGGAADRAVPAAWGSERPVPPALQAAAAHTRRVQVSSTFEAAIAACTLPELVLRPGQTLTVFCAFVRQAARVMHVVDACTAASAARPTDSAGLSSSEGAASGHPRHVRLRFLHHPEFLVPGAAVVLRDGRCLATGAVTSILAMDSRSLSAPAQGRRNRAFLDRRPAGGLAGMGSATPAPKFSRRGLLSSLPDAPLGIGVLSQVQAEGRSQRLGTCLSTAPLRATKSDGVASASATKGRSARRGTSESDDDDDGILGGIGSFNVVF